MKKAKADTKKPINIGIGYYMYSLISDKKEAISYLDSVIKYSINANDEYFPLEAYREKAYLLRQLYRYDEAIQNYILAENLAKNKNLDFYYKINTTICFFFHPLKQTTKNKFNYFTLKYIFSKTALLK